MEQAEAVMPRKGIPIGNSKVRAVQSFAYTYLYIR